MTRRTLFASLALAALAAPAPVAAQARLTGTFIDYFVVNRDGWFLDGTESMRYTESGSDPYSCDAFFPGAPVEGWTIQGTAGGSPFEVSQHSSFGAGFTTTSPATESGRTVSWTGTYSDGTVSLEVDQTVTFEAAERFIRVTVVVSNTGSSSITDLYYLRNADPDQGSGCMGGMGSSTNNDVRRQPPTDDNALVTARADFTDGPFGGPVTHSYVLGIGAHDPRARAHAGGFSNTDGRGEWAMPEDPDGDPGDIGVDIVFQEPSLPASASAMFEYFYVWGTSETEVEMRFDDLGAPTGPCTGVPEAGTCTTRSGLRGVCHSGVCCTGCWDGTRCRGGRTATECGVAGGACRTCVDADPCTLNTCTATGTCTNPAAPVGSSCDDGLYCSAASTCNAMGRCVESASICDDRRACTVDTCNEMTHACTYDFATGCLIGGECVLPGERHVASPCLTCDPARNRMDWSVLAPGSECGDAICAAGRLRPAPTCNDMGVCTAVPRMTCPTSRCADAMSCEAPCAADEDCRDAERCDESTGRCIGLGAMGIACTVGGECLSGACADGFCCNTTCDDMCASCALTGMRGTCTPYRAGTDPENECERACDGMNGCQPVPDAGPPPPDAGGVDAGPGDDAGGGDDGGGGDVDAGEGGGGGDDGGCGCVVPGTRAPGHVPGAALLLLAGVALVATRRRRRS